MRTSSWTAGVLGLLAALAHGAAGADCNHNNIPDANDMAGGPGVWGATLRLGLPPDAVEIYALQAADFAGAGRPDLAVLYRFESEAGYGDALGIFVNDGAGGFSEMQPALTLPYGGSAFGCADFNGDGRIDLAFIYSSSLQIYHAQPGGGFAYAFNVVLPSFSDRPVIADFNGDGLADVVVASWDYLYFIENAGNGGFYAPVVAGPANYTDAPGAAGDFNGDGKTDLVFSDYMIAVLLGNGQGQFVNGSQMSVAERNHGVVRGRLRGGAGADDIAVLVDGRVNVFYNGGHGAFALHGAFGSGADLLAAGDFRGVGRSDFAVASASGREVILLAHGAPNSVDRDHDGIPDECEDCNGNGVADSLDIASGYSADCNHNGIPDECEKDCNHNGAPDDCDIAAGASLDCNHNGIPDECEPDCNGNSRPDDCDIAGGFSADCNHDGIPDECELYRLDCNHNGVPDECDIAAGTSPDCNHNGVPDECDVAVPVLKPFALHDYAFPYQEKPYPQGDARVEVADLNGDSWPDLLFVGMYRLDDTGPVNVALFNLGGGGFGAPTELAGAASAPRTANDFAVGDLNGDGRTDLVQIDRDGLHVWLMGPNGAYQPPVTYPVEGGWVRLADLDGDGDLDVLANNNATYPFLHIEALTNYGDGRLAAPFTLATELALPSIAFGALVVGDFDRDGRPDVMVLWEPAFYTDATVQVLLNRSGPFSRDANHDGRPDECDPFAGDLDCSGRVDFRDINPFVTALGGQAAYEAAQPHCRWWNADVNGDGQVNFRDINPFVTLLVAAGGR